MAGVDATAWGRGIDGRDRGRMVRGALSAGTDGTFEPGHFRVEGEFDRPGGVRAPASRGRAGERRGRRLAVPGMVDAHYHSNEAFLRVRRRHAAGGLAPPRYRSSTSSLDGARHLPAYARGPPRAAADRHDHRRRLPLRASLALDADPRPGHCRLSHSGIRVVPALSIWDLSWTDRRLRMDLVPPSLRARSRRDPRQVRSGWRSAAKQIAAWTTHDGRLQVGLAPSGPRAVRRTCSSRWRPWPTKYDLAVHTHCLKTGSRR